MKLEIKIPKGWDTLSHTLWSQNKQNEAIQTILKIINSLPNKTSKPLYEQFSYYLFILQDYQASSFFLEQALLQYPDDAQLQRNLLVLYSRIGNYKKVIECYENFHALSKADFVIHDTLSKVYYELNDLIMAKKSGTESLRLKDLKYSFNVDSIESLKQSATNLVKGKKRVIAFSLWGNDKRYLYGALRNLLLANDIYPDWELWFYIDDSVSDKFVETIKKLGGVIHLEPTNQTLREKLCWRFKVANNNEVGYFLVRDIDSVMSIREFNAVQEWIDSNKLFHIIRDWWTHTDLILAGLWGGVAGVLPNINTLLANYTSDSMETQNIDQLFLRDCLWSYIKTNCLIHDRCFSHQNSIPLPGKIPEGNIHIGSCEYTQKKDFQEKFLLPWIEKEKIFQV